MSRCILGIIFVFNSVTLICSLSLFFSSVIFPSISAWREERSLFLKLIGVKGLGPKMALPILATGSVAGVIDAIERENLLYLKKFPKIGDKVAKQIILDLKGKLGIISTTGVVDSNTYEELIEVLKGLGYKEKEFKSVITKVDNTLTIEEQVKEALKLLLK